MRKLEELIALPKEERDREENLHIARLGLPFMIKFKYEWERTCNQLNEKRCKK